MQPRQLACSIPSALILVSISQIQIHLQGQKTGGFQQEVAAFLADLRSGGGEVVVLKAEIEVAVRREVEVSQYFLGVYYILSIYGRRLGETHTYATAFLHAYAVALSGTDLMTRLRY